MYYFLGFARLSKSNDLLVENKLEESKKLLDAAELASRKSFELSNKTRLVAGYELAKELHFLERDDESLKLLEEIIRANSYFAIKAGSDPSFGSMPIEGLIKKLMDELVSKIKPELDEYARQIEILSNIESWGINKDPNLTELKSLLPNQDIYETYFSIREFSESKKYEEIQNIWKKLEALCLGNDSYESGLLNIYNKAKEADNSGNIEDALNRLRVLINDNWYFYVKARCDLDFESIWPKIDELLNSLRDEMFYPMREKFEEIDPQLKMLSEMEAYKVKYSVQLSDVKTVLLELNKIEQMDYFSIREFKEKSWPDICQTIDNLISYCLNADNTDTFENQYKSVQALYTAGETENALDDLKSCIRNYWYHAVRALCDKNFEAVKGNINSILEDLKNEDVAKIQNYCSELRKEAQLEYTRLKQEADEIIAKVEEDFKEVDAVHQKWASKPYSTPKLGRFQEKKKNFSTNFSDSQAFLNIESIAKEAETNSVKDYFTVRETWEKLDKKSVSENVKLSFSDILQDINTIKEISSDISAILNSERKQLEYKNNWDEEKKQKEREKRTDKIYKWFKRIFLTSLAVGTIVLVYINVISPYMQSEDHYTNLLVNSIKKNESIENIELYIKNGANVNGNRSSPHDPSPIIYAAELGRTDILELLKESGADVSRAYCYIFTPWSDESDPEKNAIQKRLDMLELILETGFDPNASASGSPALEYAVQYYREELSEKYVKGAEMMINAGADINTKNIYGHTPLTTAKRFGETKMIKLLEKYNAQ